MKPIRTFPATSSNPDASKEIVFVSKTSYAKGRDVYEMLGHESGFSFVPVDDDEQSLAKQVAESGVRAFIADVVAYRGPLYDALPPGGVIARFGVGHDGIDKARATARGLWVLNTPGVLDNAVAEQAVFMLGALARNIPRLDRSMKQGAWSPERGIELQGRSVAVLGFGRIGQRLSRKLAFGFGMEVTAVDMRPESDAAHRSRHKGVPGFRADCGHHKYSTDILSALPNAEFVVLLLAATPQTHHLADEQFFRAMRSGARLVNSARGSLIDEAALFDALASGHLGGAALDVFENEPYLPVSPEKDLRTLSNLVLTPHTGSNTEESNAAMAEASGRAVIHALTKGVGDLDCLVNRPMPTHPQGCGASS
jgi:lactate dehydrogenase-like 2-hydroxyacid dehydrogenase